MGAYGARHQPLRGVAWGGSAEQYGAAMYQVSDLDMRELEAAQDSVSELRRELEVSEEQVRGIRVRLYSAELQLANAIRRVTRSAPSN